MWRPKSQNEWKHCHMYMFNLHCPTHAPWIKVAMQPLPTTALGDPDFAWRLHKNLYDLRDQPGTNSSLNMKDITDRQLAAWLFEVLVVVNLSALMFFGCLLCLLYLRATWPTMKSSTWVAMGHESKFLQLLHRTESWDKAGYYWRTHFFMKGQLYRHIGTGQVFRALNSQSHAAPLWPVQKLSHQAHGQPSSHDEEWRLYGSPIAHLSKHKPDLSSYWQPDTSTKAAPTWMAMLHWDDFEAAPCHAISPAGMVAFGCPWSSVPPGICLYQTENFQDTRAVAAKQGFAGLTKDDLFKLAKESGMCIIGFCS